MKRTPRAPLDEPARVLAPSVPFASALPAAQMQQAGAGNMHALQQSAPPPGQQPAPQPAATHMSGATSTSGAGAGLVPAGGFARAPRPGAPVINYHLKGAGVQYAPHKPPPAQQPRLKMAHAPPSLERQSPGAGGGGGVVAGAGASAAPAAQFQRLKVEDALSYLDQVKYKFNTQPQVYNDFLDIMKEFKSQTANYSSIDTPGVIKRVSNLFKGHPELIVGFNTFLPPGYKIEVQSNGQVSVSMPSPTAMGGVGGVSGVGVSGVGNVGGVVLGAQHAPPQPQLLHLLPVQQGGGVVHNLSVSAPPANTLHHISQAHQQIEAASIHHAQGGAAPGAAGAHAAAAGQPVEFNHAIEYVNKIKSRFSRQPDKYKRFLEILHAYQRGHRDVKEPQARQQTEQEVYSQVAKLFENQEDLLAEFGQFLPDAKAVTKPQHYAAHARSPPPPQLDSERFGGASPQHGSAPPAAPAHAAHTGHAAHAGHAPTHALPAHAHTLHHAPMPKHPSSGSVPAPLPQHHHLKRSPSFSSTSQVGLGAPPNKKARCSSGTPPGGAGATSAAGAAGPALRDVSYAEAAKLATAQDYSFFDRTRKALRSQHVYDNFLRCLLLFTNEIISSTELLSVTGPFLCRHPELQKWLQDFVGPPSPPHTPTAATLHTGYGGVSAAGNGAAAAGAGAGAGPAGGGGPLLGYSRDRLGDAKLRNERAQGESAMDIDLSTCKRLGTSYCALPRDISRRCSGRTPLCKEVLNDTWVSIPTWSEDSTFVTSRKTQYEEYIYRCEDERFELDVVIETNAATIRVLEGVQKKLSRMTPEDAAKYRLDDCLGGHSPTIHQRALRRIYGDKAVDIIAGLKKNPVVAVPVVLRRLKAKEDEWREAQKGFNKQWREQNEKYYLKSLDHQGINFKQNDLKAMRSKSLFNEVEAAYAARRPAPHLVVDYQLHSRHEAIKILRDASELLIHHARRQTGIQKTEKRRIKQMLRHLLPDLFAHPRQQLSDDERDDEEKEAAGSPRSPPAEPDERSAAVPPAALKHEKHESSESDNASDKSSRHNKNDKENKPKNNNMESKDGAHAGTKRSSSNEEPFGFKVEPDVKAEDLEDDYRDYPPNEALFVCTSSWYLFLRLHGVLCARLGAARRAAAALAEGPAPAAAAASALRLRPCNLPPEASEPRHYYSTLLDLVRAVLDGNTEPAAYEDAVREMLGIKAYPAYTLDKVVSIAVRQLQHCASEPWSVRAAEMAARGMRAGAGYVRRAARFLRQDHTTFLVRVFGGDECKVTFELLESGAEGRASPQHNSEAARLSPAQARASAGGGVARVAAWSLYAERYARADAQPPAAAARHKPVFLRRNARRAGAAPTSSAAAGLAPAPAGPAPRRRKPARLHDQAECTLAGGVRLVARRAHVAYRAGSLAAARASHARLHAARRARFRAWLRRHLHPHLHHQPHQQQQIHHQQSA
ncbi:paired amphipathic helix protein Sin3a isoform X2 [Battus philenor]|uniref:paired amphipathic helix protein Sin3a isoform X2 n=1 Tax=Battus philenor TaxID=42288 RepID=UPI0035D051AD